MLLKGKLLLSTQELNLLLGRDMSSFPPLRDITWGSQSPGQETTPEKFGLVINYDKVIEENTGPSMKY